MNGIQIFAGALIVLCVSLPVMCIIKMNMIRRFREKAITTTVLVTAVEKRYGYRSYYYIVSLQYKTVDTEQLFNAQTVSAKKRKTGDILPLMYLRNNPATFRTDFGKWLRWMLVITIIFMCLISWFCYWLLHLEYTVRPS